MKNFIKLAIAFSIFLIAGCGNDSELTRDESTIRSGIMLAKMRGQISSKTADEAIEIIDNKAESRKKSKENAKKYEKELKKELPKIKSLLDDNLIIDFLEACESPSVSNNIPECNEYAENYNFEIKDEVENSRITRLCNSRGHLFEHNEKCIAHMNNIFEDYYSSKKFDDLFSFCGENSNSNLLNTHSCCEKSFFKIKKSIKENNLKSFEETRDFYEKIKVICYSELAYRYGKENKFSDLEKIINKERKKIIENTINNKDYKTLIEICSSEKTGYNDCYEKVESSIQRIDEKLPKDLCINLKNMSSLNYYNEILYNMNCKN